MYISVLCCGLTTPLGCRWESRLDSRCPSVKRCSLAVLDGWIVNLKRPWRLHRWLCQGAHSSPRSDRMGGEETVRHRRYTDKMANLPSYQSRFCSGSFHALAFTPIPSACHLVSEAHQFTLTKVCSNAQALTTRQ